MASTQRPATHAVPARAEKHMLRFRRQLSTMRHIPGVKLAARDCMGARYGELTAPGLGWVASSAATEAGTAEAVAAAASKLLSEPRASEHEACPRTATGVCEGHICRRVL